MKVSDNGINLIKIFEGFRSSPYLCAAGKATIGYGSTYYPDGRKVTIGDPQITENKATKMLLLNLTKFENCINNSVKSQLTQNQFDALCCFIYNIGAANFTSSTLLKKVNINPNDESIKNEFMKWNKIRVDGLLTKSSGLTRRRQTEYNLYCSKK